MVSKPNLVKKLKPFWNTCHLITICYLFTFNLANIFIFNGLYIYQQTSIYLLNMKLNIKQNQYLTFITICSFKNYKHKKTVNYKNH